MIEQPPSTEAGLRNLAQHSAVLAARGLRPQLKPRMLLTMAIGPLVFLVAFYLVFGRLLGDFGVDYGQYLPPAITVQSMMLVAMSTAYFVTAERRNGMLSRWRTMPIHRAAVPGGRLIVDAVRAGLHVVLIAVAGSVLGFRFERGVLAAIAFAVVAIGFALSLSAATATIGLSAADPESIMSMLFLPYLPLLTLSTAFVPLDAFPGWLQPWVRISPVSAVSDALRALSTTGHDVTPVWTALLWMVCLGGLFGFTAARAFGRRA